ncbi:hypothetical protein Hesp01_26360 [Herbidospora sp. NBRC 101105]|nr:hypothetical protein Hesp01_26360 [Herbidospora sp. NBRC 101105]
MPAALAGVPIATSNPAISAVPANQAVNLAKSASKAGARLAVEPERVQACPAEACPDRTPDDVRDIGSGANAAPTARC